MVNMHVLYIVQINMGGGGGVCSFARRRVSGGVRFSGQVLCVWRRPGYGPSPTKVVCMVHGGLLARSCNFPGQEDGRVRVYSSQHRNAMCPVWRHSKLAAVPTESSPSSFGHPALYTLSPTNLTPAIRVSYGRSLVLRSTPLKCSVGG